MLQRHSAPIWATFGALLALAAMLALTSLQPRPRVITQAQIDAAVRHSLEKDPLPSPAMKAYEGVARSVVRVVGLMDEEDDAKERPDKRAMDRSLGTRRGRQGRRHHPRPTCMWCGVPSACA